MNNPFDGSKSKPYTPFWIDDIEEDEELLNVAVGYKTFYWEDYILE